MDLLTQITRHIKSQQLFQRGDTVIIGFSGGPDSMTLLDILFRLRHELGLKIIVAHFNHSCRHGNDHDENFAQAQAEQYGLKFHTEKWTHPQTKTKNTNSFPPSNSWEDQARKARTYFFQKIAYQYKTDIISLGHTLDDSAETILMKILRGSGLRGLRSIQPRSQRDGLVWVRPLITVTKKECLNYLSQNNLTYCTDPTNAENDFFRNRVRNEILPYLEKSANPQTRKHLVELAQRATEDYTYLEKIANKKFKLIHVKSPLHNQITLDRTKWQRLDPALQNMTLQLATSHLLQTDFLQIPWAEFNRIRLSLNTAKETNQFCLPNNITLKSTTAHIIIIKNVNSISL